MYICLHMFAYSHFLSNISGCHVARSSSSPLSLYSNIPHYAAYGHPSVSVPNVSIRGFSLCPTSLFMFRFTPVAAFRQAAAAADAHFEAFQPELRAAQDA